MVRPAILITELIRWLPRFLKAVFKKFLNIYPLLKAYEKMVPKKDPPGPEKDLKTHEQRKITVGVHFPSRVPAFPLDHPGFKRGASTQYAGIQTLVWKIRGRVFVSDTEGVRIRTCHHITLSHQLTSRTRDTLMASRPSLLRG